MRKRGRAGDEREGKREWREERGPDEAGPFRRGRMPHPPGDNGDKSGFHGVENFRNLGSMPWNNGTIWVPWRGKTANSGSMAWKFSKTTTPPAGSGEGGGMGLSGGMAGRRGMPWVAFWLMVDYCLLQGFATWVAFKAMEGFPWADNISGIKDDLLRADWVMERAAGLVTMGRVCICLAFVLGVVAWWNKKNAAGGAE